MIDKPNRQQPVLIGGVVMGLLSSIPIISAGNLCCCLWVLLGGALASYLLIKRSPVLPVKTGDGAVTGALAGVVGAVVYLVVGVPLGLLMQRSSMSMFQGIMGSINNPEFRRAMEQAMEQAQHQPMSQRLGSALLGWFIGSIVMVGMATLGGVIGVALFEKRKGAPPPPSYPPPGYPPNYPPPGYGGPPPNQSNQPPY